MKLKPASYFLIFFLVLGGVFLVYSLTLGPFRAKVVGLFVSSVMIMLGIIQLVIDIRRTKKAAETEQQLPGKGEAGIFLRRAGILALWMGGFALAVYLLGFLISIPIFILLYLKLRHTGWLVSIITAIATTAAVYGLFEVFLLRPLWKGTLPALRWLIYLVPFL